MLKRGNPSLGATWRALGMPTSTLFLTLLLVTAGCNDGTEGDDDDDSSPVSSPEPHQTGLQVSVASLDFGTVDVGDTADEAVELKNVGESDLLLTVTLPDNPETQYSVTSGTQGIPDHLAVGQTVSLTVTFAPSVNGDAPGTLRIDTNDAVTPRVNVALTATGYLTDDDRDQDGDGYTPAGGDCDDSDEEVNPGATEVCNSQDDDCDGKTDENASEPYYKDDDGDGYGNPNVTKTSCDVPSGYVTQADDCDDSDAGVNPGAAEICDNQDNNCDAQIDEDVTAQFYKDRDADGYGDPDSTATGCTAPEGYVALGGDCSDNEVEVNPSALEVCDGVDNNCDTEIDEGVESTYYADADADGHGDSTDFVSACEAPEGYVESADDCNDEAAAAYPGASEICDGVDNDCDGSTDAGLGQTYYHDVDGDGHGDPKATVTACAAPAGYVSSSDDCLDSDATVYTGANEACDGVDNDCDKQVDENGKTLYYYDYDKDGHGDPAISRLDCNNPPDYVTAGDDCNDRDPGVYPGAAEVCNGRDDNCDSNIDEGVLTTWYLDADHDGYGTDDSTLVSCSKPGSVYVDKSGDCNDLDKSIYPGATEVCDNKDNNCDGSKDEGVTISLYTDADNDGYGNPKSPTTGCSATFGLSKDNTDCDDGHAEVHPGAVEVCDELDNDCNGQIDEGAQSTYYVDVDGDGYGSTAGTLEACKAPKGYATNSTDCDDADSKTHPNANELCDTKDNDCDGSVDEGVTSSYYTDADGDSYGDVNSPVKACSAVPGLVTNSIDCNDTDSAVYPGAAELCDSKDNNCNGAVDEAGGSKENTYYRDQDGDGYGTTTPTTYACSAPSGYVADNTDCNDKDGTTYPGAKEQCKGQDNNCDGQASPAAAPTASNNGPLCGGATLQLTASSISGATYSWIGPNGFSATQQNPTLTDLEVADSGVYSVTATTPDQCTTAAANTTVTVSQPVSSFSVSPSIPQPNAVVSFTPTQSNATYAWTFEGGSPGSSTSAAPTATWAAEGTYKVTLTVTQNGCSSTSTQSVKVAKSIASCRAILDGNPAAASGVYNIDPDGSGPVAAFDVFCDMTSDGGGWTLALNLNTSDGNVSTWAGTIWTTTSEYGIFANRFTKDYKSLAAQTLTGTKLLLIVRNNTDAAGATPKGWRSWNLNGSKKINDFFTVAMGGYLDNATGGCNGGYSGAGTKVTNGVLSAGVVAPYDPFTTNGTNIYTNSYYGGCGPTQDAFRMSIWYRWANNSNVGLGLQMDDNTFSGYSLEAGTNLKIDTYPDPQRQGGSSSGYETAPDGTMPAGSVGSGNSKIAIGTDHYTSQATGSASYRFEWYVQ